MYHVLDGISNCYSEMMYLRILHKIKMMIFGRIGSLNAIKFEDTECLNTLEKVKNGAASFPGLFFTVVDILFYYIPYFIFMGWYLSRAVSGLGSKRDNCIHPCYGVKISRFHPF